MGYSENNTQEGGVFMTVKRKVTINGDTYTLVRDFKDDAELRAGFNELTQKVFQFNFEGWYQAGYWKERYCPFALMKDGRFVANVSANDLEFFIRGEKKKLIQIGTVMTDPAYRGKGLSRFLMEAVLREYEGKTDFQYLFAGDAVSEFYPKFGFEPAEEVQCKKIVTRQGQAPEARILNLDDPEDLASLLRIGHAKESNAEISMIGNFELNLFYCGFFLRDKLFYLPELDVIAVAERTEKNLLIYDVFAGGSFDLDCVIQALLTKDTMEVLLGFTPVEAASYDRIPYKEKDRTLYLRGGQIGEAMFPLLAQA